MLVKIEIVAIFLKKLPQKWQTLYQDVTTRGFIYVKDNFDVIKEAKRISREVILEHIDYENKRIDYTGVKNEIREKLGAYCYEETGCKPMIITVIQEV